LLSEANQWPEDTRPYFGEGDEFQMAFHFPVMPRVFMSLAQGDRQPILDILARTPPIPELCQWCTFLRCHDELTLEMVTEEERAFLWDFYAPEPRMRLNLGIRRRLAPLLDNDHRRIELANSILFTLPGSPIIYYGDEIGMGDNIWLEDRDGLRTPMQWSDDKNAGFSIAPPSRLYSSLIEDEMFGYRKVNVRAQQRDPSSLFHTMRKMISARKKHKSFGRGDCQFLHPDNTAVLAYIRQHDDEAILVVNNLSSSPQSVALELAPLSGFSPKDILSGSSFPPVADKPYVLVLDPYQYLWLLL
jgi:maltose alpha-D-glucosyltransferase/alpha-amylase